MIDDASADGLFAFPQWRPPFEAAEIEIVDKTKACNRGNQPATAVSPTSMITILLLRPRHYGYRRKRNGAALSVA
jgi:hypothetical protein